MEPQYIGDKEAAQITGLSRSYFQKCRVYGGGPPFAQLTPKKRAYWLPHLLAWFNKTRGCLVAYPDLTEPVPARFVNDREAEAITGLSRSWFQKRRVYGGGPPSIPLTPSRQAYWLPDLLAWFRMFGVYQSTSQAEPDPDPADTGTHEVYYKWLDDGTYRLRYRKARPVDG